MDDKFLNSGKNYDLLVDWDKRLAHEIPFILELLERGETEKKTILDVGCGTGRHIQKLFERGFRVTGIDSDESMIGQAREIVPEAELIVGDFLKKGPLDDRKFDIVYSLGNSVGLLARSSGYEKIIGKFHELLNVQGGLLIFHTLNFEKERNGWSNVRSLKTEEGEYIFLRRFATTEKFIQPEIITLHKGPSAKEWEMAVNGPAYIPRVSRDEMETFLKKLKFDNIRVYGDYRKAPFNSSSSVDMIWIAEKNT